MPAIVYRTTRRLTQDGRNILAGIISNTELTYVGSLFHVKTIGYHFLSPRVLACLSHTRQSSSGKRRKFTCQTNTDAVED